jgi:hypothetical protein
LASFFQRAAPVAIESQPLIRKTPQQPAVKAVAPIKPRDKRGAEAAIPSDLASYVSDMQMLAIKQLENFGWQLAFVRRPLFLEPMVVVKNSKSLQYALLETDGTIMLEHGLMLRN